MSNEVKANAKLKEIYKFLEENKEFNGKLQNAVYESCLDMRKPTKIGFRLLLWDVVHTQSQTDLDKLEDFWLFMNGYCCDEKWELCDVKIFVKDLISKDFWQEGLKAIKANKELVKRGLIIEKANLGGLQEYINNMHPLDAFFEALKTTPGWGDKTAALAQKSLYNIFKEKETLVSGCKLKLPVDAVIQNIFCLINENETIQKFDEINLTIKGVGDNAPEIWDDLWFWGFFTQKSKKINQDKDRYTYRGVRAGKPNKNKKKLSYRSFEWNPAKFHSLKFSYIFKAKEVKEIEAKAKKFLEFFPNKDVERTYQAN